jgi:hypothetical protein
LFALIGADRIDLFSGRGNFSLTPYLILTPIIIFLFLVDTIRRTGTIKIVIPSKLRLLLVLMAIFILTLMLSSVFSADVWMSIIKLVLLSIEIVYSILLILIWKKYGLLEKVLLNGAYLGISFWSIFAIIQLLLWFSGITGYDVTSEQHSFINILPGTIGSFAPRLCGVSLDPNRGGLLLVIYGYMILILSKPSKLKNFLFLFILLLLLSTISKTANTSAYTTYFLVMIWGIANKKISYRILLKSCVLLVPAILLLLYMFSRENISQKIDVSMTLKTILSTSDDSSG